MPLHIPTRRLIIRYTGIFDMDGLYKVMVEWLKARRFWFEESDYKHHQGNEYGKEEEMTWVAKRNIDSYVRYEIHLYFHLWEVNKVEVVQDNKKKIMTKARMEIWFDGNMVVDYQGKWEKTKFHKGLRDFYHKYILGPDVIMGSAWWDPLYYRIYKLHDMVKAYLDMQGKGFEYKRYVGDNIAR